MIRKAMLYDPLEDQRVQCCLCAHRCKVNPGRRGLCGVRENKDGAFYSLVYGTIVAENIDPIEKKPFFHVLPGSKSYSIATAGCNFFCGFCQNASLSQTPRNTLMIMGEEMSPEEIVNRAINSGCRTIAYTYTEPTVYFELAYDTARLAAKQSLRNVFVTNGYMTPEALHLIAPYLDAANVDLKSFRDDFYKKQCGGRLEPVLETLRLLKSLGIWMEITTLLIPGFNDSEAELTDIAGFIAGLGREIPWHISRFHPQYRMRDMPVTPLASLHLACDIGKKAGLKYVYSGNAPGDACESTFCAHCGLRVIERYGYEIQSIDLNGDCCRFCKTPLDGIFS
ncbi:MAG: AmmeMemoRadiSam system radical SAM enzyme [Smithellaceae bacterium]